MLQDVHGGMKKDHSTYVRPPESFPRHLEFSNEPPYIPLPVLMVRFWKKVEAQNTTECWIWKGATSPAPRLGYGFLAVKTPNGKHIVLAHRIALAMRLGRWPRKDEITRHQCNVRNCVNPLHLRPGTHMDNYRDCVFAKRNKIGVPGHEYANKKLTDKNAKKLLEMYYGKDGNGFYYKRFNTHKKWTISSLAERYGVPKAVVMRAVLGKSKMSIRITEAQRIEAIRLWTSRDGQASDKRLKTTAGMWTTKTLAAHFGVTQGVVGALIEGKTYRQIPRPVYHSNWADKGVAYKAYVETARRKKATS